MSSGSPYLINWLVYRDECFANYDPEECDVRIGLVEEYLYGLLTILQQRNKERNELLVKSISLLLADEKEERRFIEEDAYLLPFRVFSEGTQSAIADVVAEMEERGRHAIEAEYASFAVETLVLLEVIQRKTVAVEFLDSVFLKLCQTQPQWMWRRLDDLCRPDDSAFRQARQQLFDEEAQGRRTLVGEYNEHAASCYIASATAEKQVMLAQWLVPESPSAHEIIVCSATAVQAVYRGWRTRKALGLVK